MTTSPTTPTDREIILWLRKGMDVMLKAGEEIRTLRAELDAAYAELSKQEIATTAVFDQDVWRRMHAWRGRKFNDHT